MIRTHFGEIHISYQGIDDLKSALQDLEQQITLIGKTAGTMAPPPPRTPKQGYESYYRFTPSGSVELLKVPPKQNEAVALVLFAHHPDPVSSTELEMELGINDIARRVLAQKPNETLFRKADGKYGLTFAGIQMVQQRFGEAIVDASEDG